MEEEKKVSEETKVSIPNVNPYSKIREEDDAETEVVYNLDVDLLVRLPGFVKRRAESKIVHAAVDDLRERLEAEIKNSGESEKVS